MFKWWRDRQREKILEKPFPEAFNAIIKRYVGHARFLSPEERQRLREMVQVFVEEKTFVGCGGLEITDDIRVTIAANACMLILGREHDLYRRVESINVYPSTVLVPGRSEWHPDKDPQEPKAILGQAILRGPVIVVWDAVKRGSRAPWSGHNVVMHEFAHKLDMLDDDVDGTPLLPSRAKYENWSEVCGEVYFDLKKRVRAGRKTLLGSYAATNEAEFFAVATEVFFERPRELAKAHKRLYWLLAEYYNQDPGARMPGKGPRNARKRRGKPRRALSMS